MRYWFVFWVVGHISYEAMPSVEACTHRLLQDKRLEVTMRACLPTSKLLALLETGRVE